MDRHGFILNDIFNIEREQNIRSRKLYDIMEKQKKYSKKLSEHSTTLLHVSNIIKKQDNHESRIQELEHTIVELNKKVNYLMENQ